MGTALLASGKIFFLAVPCSMRGLSSLSVCACVCAKLLQSCPTLCDPMDCSLPGSSFCGILQARTLEWAACPPPGDSPGPDLSLFCLLHWRQVLYHQRHLGSPSSLRPGIKPVPPTVKAQGVKTGPPGEFQIFFSENLHSLNMSIVIFTPKDFSCLKTAHLSIYNLDLEKQAELANIFNRKKMSL